MTSEVCAGTMWDGAAEAEVEGKGRRRGWEKEKEKWMGADGG